MDATDITGNDETKAALVAGFWGVANDPKATSSQRLRALEVIARITGARPPRPTGAVKNGHGPADDHLAALERRRTRKTYSRPTDNEQPDDPADVQPGDAEKPTVDAASEPASPDQPETVGRVTKAAGTFNKQRQMVAAGRPAHQGKKAKRRAKP